MTQSNRNDFTPTVKDKVLKECKYCCVICGKIPVEFAHIDTDHSNNNYMNCLILCPSCHDTTENNYDVEYLRSIKKKITTKKYNFPEMTQNEFYYFNPQKKISIQFRAKGNKNFDTSFNDNSVRCLFSIDNKDYFLFKEKQTKLVFSLDIENKDGNVLAQIINNVIVIKNPDIIIHAGKKVLRIYDDNNNIDFEVRKDGKKNALIFDINGFFINKNRVDVIDNYISFNGCKIGACHNNTAHSLIGLRSLKPSIISFE